MGLFQECFNAIQTTVAAPYTAGSGVLSVASLPAAFALGVGEFTRVTTLRGGVVRSILMITARSALDLTVSMAIEGTTDVDLIVGDAVRCYITAGTITDVSDEVEGLLAPFSPVTAGQVKFDDGTGFDAVDPTGLKYVVGTQTLEVNKLQVGGSVPASPGTASGSDAAVINALILIIRNAGLCS